MATAEVKAFLHALPPAERRIVSTLRALIYSAAPDAEESLLWGGLSYHQPGIGGRVKGAVCQIVVKRGVVRLDFIHGVRLADECMLLRGTGKSKRYLTIPDSVAAKRPELVMLIKEAASLNRADFL